MATSSESLYPVVVGVMVTCTVLNVLFVAARLVGKRASSPLHIEDYLLITALALFVVSMTANWVSVTHGGGRHNNNVFSPEYVYVAKIKFILENIYFWFAAIAKCALVLQIQRIFAPTKSGNVFVVCQTLIWLNIAFYASAWIALLAACTPTARMWDYRITEGHCVNVIALCAIAAIINIISDATMLFMPLWTIYRLHMTLDRKLGIAAMFATGALALVCSIMRLVYGLRVSQSADIYTYAQVALWGHAEMTAIILCTCIPWIPRFVQVVMGRVKSTASSPSSATDGYSYTPSRSSKTPFMKTQKCTSCKFGLPCTHHDSTNTTVTVVDTENSLSEHDLHNEEKKRDTFVAVEERDLESCDGSSNSSINGRHSFDVDDAEVYHDTPAAVPAYITVHRAFEVNVATAEDGRSPREVVSN